MRKYTKKVLICLTNKDYGIISKKAELSEMNVSEYLRECALGKRVEGFRLADLNRPDEQCQGQMTLGDVL